MRNEKSQQFLRIAGILLTATAIGCLASAAALLGCAVLFTGMARLPQTVLLPLTVAVCAFGAFSGGFSAGRMSGRSGWLFGLWTGVLFGLVLYGCSRSVIGEPATTFLLIKAVLLLLSGTVGGMIGVHRKRRLR